MITHEEARKELNHIYIYCDNLPRQYDLEAYITQQEDLQAEHEELKKDVARFFYLLNNYEEHNNDEFTSLGDKLSKVGNNNG